MIGVWEVATLLRGAGESGEGEAHSHCSKEEALTIGCCGRVEGVGGTGGGVAGAGVEGEPPLGVQGRGGGVATRQAGYGGQVKPREGVDYRASTWSPAGYKRGWSWELEDSLQEGCKQFIEAGSITSSNLGVLPELGSSG